MASAARGDARWERDPTGRYAQRYWDGTGWADHVAGADGGAPHLDPLGPDDAIDAWDPSSRPAAGADEAAATLGAGPHRDDHLGAGPPGDHATSTGVPAVGTAPAWFGDPSGRYSQRYWDGSAWTAFVAGSAGGPPRHDPLPASDTTPGTSAPARDGASEDPGGAAGMSAAGAGITAAAWFRDPSGRHPQRYWDGERWTGFVAGAEGGGATVDELGVDEHWPSPGAATPGAGGPGRRPPWRTALPVAAAVAALGAVALVLMLTGVLGGDSRSSAEGARATASSRRPAPTDPADDRAGARHSPSRPRSPPSARWPSCSCSRECSVATHARPPRGRVPPPRPVGRRRRARTRRRRQGHRPPRPRCARPERPRCLPARTRAGC